MGRKKRKCSSVCSMLAMALVAFLLSCQPPPAEQHKESSSSLSAADESLGTVFIRGRIEVLVKTTIPQAIKVNNHADAMRSCDVGVARVRSLGNAVDEEASKAIVAELEELCSVQVPAYLLENLAAEVEKAGEDTKSTRCEMGTIVMGFVHAHAHNAPAVDKAQKRVFELCPNLQAEWDEINKEIEKAKKE